MARNDDADLCAVHGDLCVGGEFGFVKKVYYLVVSLPNFKLRKKLKYDLGMSDFGG